MIKMVNHMFKFFNWNPYQKCWVDSSPRWALVAAPPIWIFKNSIPAPPNPAPAPALVPPAVPASDLNIHPVLNRGTQTAPDQPTNQPPIWIFSRILNRHPPALAVTRVMNIQKQFERAHSGPTNQPYVWLVWLDSGWFKAIKFFPWVSCFSQIGWFTKVV